ncbi:MAG: chemotaxis protein CheX [Deltaproteobacteria bacterium]|nr:chemotaxis protein CheX [Deltaproteobacteria bacterium]
MGIEHQEFKNILQQALCETMENMAFMMVDTEAEGPAEMKAADCLKSSMLILEPCSGELELAMPRKLISKIAGALYSLRAEEITESICIDVIAELLNTITGVLIRRMIPENSEYKLGLPECESQGLLEASSAKEQFEFFIDEQPLTIAADMEAFWD